MSPRSHGHRRTKVLLQTPGAFFEKHLRHVCLSFQEAGGPSKGFSLIELKSPGDLVLDESRQRIHTKKSCGKQKERKKKKMWTNQLWHKGT